MNTWKMVMFGLLLICTTGSSANAQQEQFHLKPLDIEPDVNQVDLLSGRYLPQLPLLSIPAAPRLSLHTLQQFDSKVIGVLYARTMEREESFSLTFGGKTSEYLTCRSSDCEPATNTGSSFRGRVGDTSFRYTQGQTGIDVFYTSRGSYFNYAGDPYASVSAQVTYFATLIRYPDGESLQITYDKNTIGQITHHRPIKVTSTIGYELHLAYFSNDIYASGWSSLKNAYIVRTVSPSNILAEYNYTTIGEFTDPGGLNWQFSGFSNALGANDFAKNFTFRGPADTQNRISVTSATRTYGSTSHNNFVTSVMRDGQTYQYTYTVPTGNAFDPRSQFSRLVITGPANYRRTLDYFVWGGVNKRQLIQSDTNRLGHTTRYTYTRAGQLASVTFPEGNKVEFTYDRHGNVTTRRQTGKPGSGLPDIFEQAVYPTNCSDVQCHRPLYTVDANGHRTDYTFASGHGGLLTLTGPADSASRRLRTTNSYSLTGNVYRLTSQTVCVVGQCSGAQAQVTQYTYWQNTALLSTVTQTNGSGSVSQVTTYSYDNAGRLLSEYGPLSGTDDATFYRYDSSGRLTWQSGPKNAAGYYNVERVTYPTRTQRRLLKERGTISSRSSTSLTVDVSVQEYLNNLNQVIRKTVAAPSTIAQTWQYTYDARGRLVCQAQRMNSAAFSQLPSSACTIGSEGNHGPDRITRTSYDHVSQVLTITTAVGTVAESLERTHTYSANRNLNSVEDGNGNITVYTYDGFDRLQHTTFANSTYEQNTYDAAGNLLILRKRDGTTLRYTYNARHQRVSMIVPSEDTVVYEYDGLGRELSVRRGTRYVDYRYDGLGRLLESNTNGRKLTYAYNLANQRTRLTFPDGFYVTFNHDHGGRLTEIHQNGSTQVLNYTYDRIGRVQSIGRGTGASSSIQYDRMNRLTQYNHSGITNISYAYNPANQLTSRTVSQASYQIQVPTIATSNYTTNSLNQYTRVNVGGTNRSLTYSSAGNLLSFDGWTYQYDHQNRLTRAAKSGTTVSLTYDPIGRLSTTNHNGSTIEYLYDGDELVAEYNSSGTLLRRYIHGLGVDDPVIRYDGAGTGSRRYLHSDERGSIIAETNASGGILTSHRYGPYGEPINGSTSRFRYTGQALIPGTELYHYKARVYHPTLGRFLQTDPVGYADQMNLYAYVGNDPVNMRDPTGLSGCSDMQAQGLSGDCFEASNFDKTKHGNATVVATMAIDIMATENMPLLESRQSENLGYFWEGLNGEIAFVIAESQTVERKGVLTTTSAVPSSAIAIGHSHPEVGGSAIAGPRDDFVVIGGRPNYVYQSGRISVVERSDGQYRVRVIYGNLSLEERRSLQRKLNIYQRRAMQ